MRLKQIKFPDSSYTYWDKDSGYSGNLIAGLEVSELGLFGLPGTTFKMQTDGGLEGEVVLNAHGSLSLDFSELPKLISLKLKKTDAERAEQCNHNVMIDMVYKEV